MKTNLVLCLALLAATGTLPAEQKGRPSTGTHRQVVKPAPVKRVMPTPQARLQPAQPSTTKVTKSPALTRGIPRTAGSSIPADNRIPGNSAATHHGRNVANGVREMSTLRHSGLDNLRENFGSGGTQPQGQKAPADPFSNDSYAQRDPKAPAGISRNNNGGLTDVRGSAEGSRQGNGRPMSVFGYNLSTSGPRTGRIYYGSDGNNRTSTSSTGVGNGGFHSTIEHRDDNGRTTGYTDTWTTADQSGTRTTTDIYDANGQFAGSETVTEFPDGSTQSKSVGADGSVIITSIDAQGQTTQSEAAGFEPPPAHQSGDRTPDGIGTGGPVGPSAAAVSGVMRLDLLRQHANGEGNGSGPGQYSIAGRTGANQVRPGENTHTPGPRVRSQNTVVNPGPIDSTPGSGDDRP